MAEQSNNRQLGRVALPEASRSPWWELTRRLLMAFGILFGTVMLVYLDREGYYDNNDPTRQVGMIDSIYYTTVTLSTTGYGDIAPYTDRARLINAFIITPARTSSVVPINRTRKAILAGVMMKALISRARSVYGAMSP